MTLTPNADCSEIILSSEALNASNIANVLTVSINGAEEITLSIAASALTYTLNAAALGVDSLENGVYQFTLTSTQSDASDIPDVGCVALLCDLECEEVNLEMYSSTDNILPILALEGLKHGNNCVTCDCTYMLQFYNTLTNGNTTTTSCGCG